MTVVSVISEDLRMIQNNLAKIVEQLEMRRKCSKNRFTEIRILKENIKDFFYCHLNPSQNEEAGISGMINVCNNNNYRMKKKKRNL